MQLSRNMAFVRVTTPRAFGRAGIRFAAGVTEMELLDLTAQQIIALASEPMFVFEAYNRAEDEWVVFPAPAPAGVPILEAELALAKAMVAKSRELAGPIGDAIAGGVISGLSEGTKLAMGGAYGLAILPGDGIGGLAAAVADQNLAARLAAEAGRPDDDMDKPEDGAAASAETAHAATEAGASSAPASGTAVEGDAASNTTAQPAPNPPSVPNPAPEAAPAVEAQAPARAAGKAAKPSK